MSQHIGDVPDPYAPGTPRRIDLIVYGQIDGEEKVLSHLTYDGTIERVREMEDVLSTLFRRWQGL